MVTASLSGPSFGWQMSVPSTVNDWRRRVRAEIVVSVVGQQQPAGGGGTSCSAAISEAARAERRVGRAGQVVDGLAVLSEWHLPLTQICAPFGPMVMVTRPLPLPGLACRRTAPPR